MVSEAQLENMKSAVMQIHKQKPAQNTLHGEEYRSTLIFSLLFSA